MKKAPTYRSAFRRADHRWTQVATVTAILGVPVLAYTYDLPGTPFESGDPISASDVNAKFDALLEAVNDLDASAVRNGQDVELGEVSVDRLTVHDAPTKTLTYWADRAMRCTVNTASCDSTATPCWASINTRPGCIVSGMTAPTRITLPLDRVPDGTLTAWGMHLGHAGDANTWTCSLRYAAQTQSSVTVQTGGTNWSRTVSTQTEILVDNASEIDDLSSGWDIICESASAAGRLDLHQVYLQHRES